MGSEQRFGVPPCTRSRLGGFGAAYTMAARRPGQRGVSGGNRRGKAVVREVTRGGLGRRSGGPVRACSERNTAKQQQVHAVRVCPAALGWVHVDRRHQAEHWELPAGLGADVDRKMTKHTQRQPETKRSRDW